MNKSLIKNVKRQAEKVRKERPITIEYTTANGTVIHTITDKEEIRRHNEFRKVSLSKYFIKPSVH